MELLFDLPTLCILALTLVVLFLAHRLRQSTSNTKTKSKDAPRPSGAWPLLGHLPLLGKQEEPIARTLGTIADEYGPIYSLKLGRHRAIVVSSWEMVKECLATNDAALATRPSMAVGKYIAYDHAAFAISPYGPYWRHMRRLTTTELLSNKQLDSLSHVRFTEVNACLKYLYLQSLKDPRDGKVVLDKLFEHLSFNINITMIVGKQFSDSSYGEFDTYSYVSRFKKAIFDAAYLTGVSVPSDFLPFVEWLDIKGYIKSMKHAHKEIDLIIGHWLDEHIKRRKLSHQIGSPNEDDFMDVLLSNFSEDATMSGYSRDTIIKATTMILLLTGIEGTSVMLTWAVSLLLNHANILKQAQAELDAIVGKNKWVKESDIKNLPFFQAIVKETMRLYPPSPLTGPRVAMEDCSIGGYYVPKGTRVLVNIWKLHRDPRVWSKPDEFVPGRFMNEHANIEFNAQHFEYIPFGSGRRSCPGMNLGLQMVHLMLACLIQGFDMSTVNNEPVDMSEGLGLALHKAKALDVVLAPRLPLDLYEPL